MAVLARCCGGLPATSGGDERAQSDAEEMRGAVIRCSALIGQDVRRLPTSLRLLAHLSGLFYCVLEESLQVKGLDLPTSGTKVIV
jgi:hypothetical protein